tara:strand:- start:109 stop:825 length:717 start_codon:yes stop_codon:yes gene_type:complete
MISENYVWLVWSSAFLVPWIIAYLVFPAHRQVMIWTSLFTMPFGLTEPLFVPEYWSPPSLFDLARRTGFDIESLIFCFGIGGIGAVLYNLLTRQRLQPAPSHERRRLRHRYHVWALFAPFLVFPILYLFPLNPIYPAILAMVIGAVATVFCRPDLIQKTWIGGVLFLAYYAVFLIGLEWTVPGYIARVWNLEALSGLAVAGMPVEELLFAIAFGAYWSGIYEHFTWKGTSALPVRDTT